MGWKDSWSRASGSKARSVQGGGQEAGLSPRSHRAASAQWREGASHDRCLGQGPHRKDARLLLSWETALALERDAPLGHGSQSRAGSRRWCREGSPGGSPRRWCRRAGSRTGLRVARDYLAAPGPPAPALPRARRGWVHWSPRRHLVAACLPEPSPPWGPGGPEGPCASPPGLGVPQRCGPHPQRPSTLRDQPPDMSCGPGVHLHWDGPGILPGLQSPTPRVRARPAPARGHGERHTHVVHTHACTHTQMLC